MTHPHTGTHAKNLAGLVCLCILPPESGALCVVCFESFDASGEQFPSNPTTYHGDWCRCQGTNRLYPTLSGVCPDVHPDKHGQLTMAESYRQAYHANGACGCTDGRLPNITTDTLRQALRDNGWVVAVHNDYQLDGKPFTFWLFTKKQGEGHGLAVWGEGETDSEAIAQALCTVTGSSTEGG